MTISFRYTKNLGLGLLLCCILGISIFSYSCIVKFSNHVEIMVKTEKEKMQVLHDLVRIITLSKDKLHAYQKNKTQVISPVILLINRGMNILNTLQLNPAFKNEIGDLSDIQKNLKLYRSAVFNYGEEIKAGYKGGETAREMEELAILSADDMVRLSWDMMDSIYDAISEKNALILKQLSFYRKVFGLSMIFISIFTLLIAFLISKALSYPLRQLAMGTEKITQGNLDFRVKVNSNDEIGQLANSFNKMADSLNSLLAKEKKFLEAEVMIRAEKKRTKEFAALNEELKINEQKINASHEELESHQKTLIQTQKELRKKLKDLEFYKRITIGRELRMLRLKKEINALLKGTGKEIRYEEPENM